MLFSELYKIMVEKVTFVGFRGGDPTPPGSAPDSISVFRLDLLHSKKCTLTSVCASKYRVHFNCVIYLC